MVLPERLGPMIKQLLLSGIVSHRSNMFQYIMDNFKIKFRQIHTYFQVEIDMMCGEGKNGIWKGATANASLGEQAPGDRRSEELGR